MRKTNLLMISVVGLLVLACSTSDLIPATPFVAPTLPLPTETLPAAPTATASATPTQPIQPTQTMEPTATFTSVPTLIAAGSSPTSTTSGAAPTATAQSQPTATMTLAAGSVFTSVTASGNMITWGANCPNNSVTFAAQAVSGYNITSVLLFVRLQSQSTGVTTRWSNGTSMHTDGAGMFTYSLAARGIPYYQDFQSAAWVQYQLVATNLQNQIVGRSEIVSNGITLSRCP